MGLCLSRRGTVGEDASYLRGPAPVTKVLTSPAVPARIAILGAEATPLAPLAFNLRSHKYARMNLSPT